ncbi:DMT family transporter [Labrenzia sp. PHM005]|uniref:DMT family transporter n=1 Tax=Labrenzia sp. PHM005 TaxID=2590016 RepID=UPI001FFD03C7|nr:DMT family transporter [Labrenzia sp. PHM005]
MALSSSNAPSNARAGLFLICLGIGSLSISDAIAKELTGGYPVLEILFLRNLIALPIVVLLVWKLAGPSALVSRQPVAHFLRGIVWVLAATCFFTGLRYLGLAEATTLVFIAPVFITAISALFLKEQVGWRRWSAVLAGFIGVVIVVRPGAGTFQTASVLPLVTAFLYAVFMLSARWLDKSESAWTLMLYQVITGGVLTAIAMPFVWVTPNLDDIGLFLGIAVFGTAGVTMITQAFRLAPAATIAPFEYTALLWATLLGWLFWREIPDMATYAGAAVIVASGIFIVLREGKIKDE